MRILLLGLVLLGLIGLLAELTLLEHYASVWQAVPLVALGLALGSALAVARRPSRGSVQALRLTMALLMVMGALGVWLHFDENRSFERELSSDAAGLALIWMAMRGATPLLAPGAFVQLGLLGLIVGYDHPALRRPARREAASAEEEER